MNTITMRSAQQEPQGRTRSCMDCMYAAAGQCLASKDIGRIEAERFNSLIPAWIRGRCGPSGRFWVTK